MKKFALSLLSLVLAACTSCAPPEPAVVIPEGVNGIQNALAATVALYDKKDRLVCAGERISATEVLTAYHCVVAAGLVEEDLAAIEEGDPDLKKIPDNYLIGRTVAFATSEAYNVIERGEVPMLLRSVVSRVDRKHDIALLKTAISAGPVVEISNLQVRVGEPVFLIGHPGGLAYSFARGYVSNQCRLIDGVCYLQSDIALWGGNSGGGLYSADGRLVGVTSMRFLATYGFFTGTEAILALVYTQ